MKKTGIAYIDNKGEIKNITLLGVKDTIEEGIKVFQNKLNQDIKALEQQLQEKQNEYIWDGLKGQLEYIKQLKIIALNLDIKEIEEELIPQKM